MNLIQLLPHQETIELKEISLKLRYLELMFFMISLMINALDAFVAGNLFDFDAQVGETLCQIRAYKIYVLKTDAKSSLKDSNIKILINKLKNCQQHIFSGIEEHKRFEHIKKNNRPDVYNQSVKLIDFMSVYGVPSVCLSEDVIFLYLSYFLSLYSKRGQDKIPYAIDYSQICDDANVVASYAKKLTHYYQKWLSKLSTEFIIQILSTLSNQEEHKITLPYLLQISDENRLVLPCYSVTAIILEHMLKYNFGFLFNVKLNNCAQFFEKNILFMPVGDAGFKIINKKLDEKTPIFVFSGISLLDFVDLSTGINNLIYNISHYGVKSIILGNMAQHPQYSGVKLADMSSNPYQYILDHNLLSLTEREQVLSLNEKFICLKKMAHQIGCGINNPKTFFIRHVYAQSIDFFQHEQFNASLNQVTEYMNR